MDILERLRNADADSVQRTNGSRIFAEAADEIARLRTAVGQYLAENDPEGFGCACEPNYTCGPCNAHKRQQVLRNALTPNAEITGG